MLTVKLVGGRQLTAALLRAGDDLADLRQANAAIARTIAERAQTMAPRRTGRLAASVRAGVDVSAAVVTAGGPATRYAGVVHWGWPRHHIRPNPFASKAAVDTESLWVEQYRLATQHLLDRAARSTPL